MTDFSVPVHPIALPKPAAAAALGMSVTVSSGTCSARALHQARTHAALPVVELERWAGENAERLLSEAA